uniref:Uncharacterized protein n=1 Tax=Lepeophtheirus salmonis TaxID=72036 RepID=A0A0K2U569_LEPSM
MNLLFIILCVATLFIQGIIFSFIFSPPKSINQPTTTTTLANASSYYKCIIIICN